MALRLCTLVPAQGDLPQVVLVQINRQPQLAAAPAGAVHAHPLSRSRRLLGDRMGRRLLLLRCLGE
jgi:hypothetical protein